MDVVADLPSDPQAAKPVQMGNVNSDKGGEVFWQMADWTPEWNFLGVRRRLRAANHAATTAAQL
ncbi:hypothetical protein SGFS_079010 [Streptomyces graminofaciens]|uniref:Uncharacterized protein n=1 Tax=Streptomyces graminofaciens TaxID=68212 RepID=A0ABM7FJC4_9ACTN|nr:hypothetical protein [Streptomyces graminofaciens]BBC36607.1 hypothetical protein SGFS_079010 [Streptomyces graminofaciens]